MKTILRVGGIQILSIFERNLVSLFIDRLSVLILYNAKFPLSSPIDKI